MIFDAIVTVLAGIVTYVGNLFDALPSPAFLSTLQDKVLELSGYANGYGAWFPISDAITAVTFVMAVLGAGFAIRLIRIVVSAFTGGGGSAG